MVWVCPAPMRTAGSSRRLLDYLLDGDVDAKEIYDALGTSSSTYYRRIKEATTRTPRNCGWWRTGSGSAIRTCRSGSG